VCLTTFLADLCQYTQYMLALFVAFVTLLLMYKYHVDASDGEHERGGRACDDRGGPGHRFYLAPTDLYTKNY
jgi:hypothetical protein